MFAVEAAPPASRPFDVVGTAGQRKQLVDEQLEDTSLDVRCPLAVPRDRPDRDVRGQRDTGDGEAC